jgi:excisionase family DNA binding protein
MSFREREPFVSENLDDYVTAGLYNPETDPEAILELLDFLTDEVGASLPEIVQAHEQGGLFSFAAFRRLRAGREVFTLAEAAAYLRLSESDITNLVHSQALPGRVSGNEWRFLKAAIDHWLSSGPPSAEARKAAQIAAAGAFKDDPDLLAIVEEIYRKRGRPITEDGSFNLLHGLEPGNSRP